MLQNLIRPNLDFFDHVCSINKFTAGSMRHIFSCLSLIFQTVLQHFFLGASGSSSGRLSGLRRIDSAGEKTHRQLIDCIRSKDTDALIEAIENGSSSIDYMDDVGQTLLNWASAFGTQEMVEYLCQKGADVNKGQRSSSLHYAACFGRPQIARVLLRFGANPDLRDEDGKTPLDKARERNDEGHREVASILQSPADWISPAIPPPEERTGLTADADDDDDSQKGETDEPGSLKGDPEMIPVYVKSLLPMFCQTYQSTMIQSVKRSSLGLLKKIVRYMDGQLLTEKCQENSHLVGDIVEVMVSVLDNEEDEDGHLSCLLIIQDILSKDSEGLFLEQFAKLGLFSKVNSFDCFSQTSFCSFFNEKMGHSRPLFFIFIFSI